MWMVAGVAVVAAAAVVVLAAFLEDPRRSVVPQRRGTVSAEELRSVQLAPAWRGYDRGQVDALLARAATTLEEVRRYGLVDDRDVATDPGVSAHAPLPSFLAGTEEDTAGRDPAVSEAGEVGPDDASGEELEDRGGHRPGGLDG